MSQRRKLAAILSADVVGYSRLMGDDEQATLSTLKAYRDIVAQHIAAHEGRVVDSPGDALLADFPSAVEAVNSAVDIQRELAGRNASLPEHRRMRFRIGINLGDVTEQDGALYGDGVNIAARLESLAESGGICISGTVYDHVEGKLPVPFRFAGDQAVKNIAKPVRVYHAVLDISRPLGRPELRRKYPVSLFALGVGVLVLVAAAVWRTTEGELSGRSSRPDPILAMPAGPSIAVLPFDNLGGQPQHGDFADGITEDILTGLSRFVDLRVLGRNSSAKYKGKRVDVREIGRDLGVDYVLEGSVRRTPSRVRVTAQLLKASDGSHIWVQTFDRGLTTRDVLSIQDDISERVAAALGGAFGAIASTRVRELRQHTPADIASYECILLAYNYQKFGNAQTHLAARGCLEQVVAREPNYVDALAWLGQMYVEELWSGFNPRETGPAPLEAAFPVLNRAVSLDPNHQKARHAVAMAYYYKRDLQQFRVEARRALALNPNNVETVCEMAMWLGFSGDWEESAALIGKAKRLGGDIPAFNSWTEFHYHFHRQEPQQALQAARRALELQHWATPTYMAMVYAQMGDESRTRESLAEARRLEPRFSRELFREMVDGLFLDREHYRLLMEGFDRALVLDRNV